MFQKLDHLENWLSQVPDDKVEVILIDDFTSIDATLEIESMLNVLSIKSARLIKGEFKSPGLARNAGLREASGCWIVFADSDDTLHVKELEKYLSDCLLESIQVFQFEKLNFSTNEILAPLSQTISIPDLVLNLGIWRMAFPAFLLKDCKFEDLSMGEDVLFFLDVLHKEPEIHFSFLHTYDYLIGSGNQLTANESAINELTILLRGIETRLSEYGKSNALATYMYLKNTYTSVKHLGVIKSLAYLRMSISLFLGMSFKEKQVVARIVRRLLGS